MSRGPIWTPREIALIRLHGPQGTRAVRRAVPRRSRNAIRAKAKALGIEVRCEKSGDIEGKRHRGKLPIPEHCHPYVRRFIQEANSQMATLAEIADRAGIRRERFAEWKRSADPRLGEFIAALNVLDLDLAIVPKGGDDQCRNNNAEGTP